MFVYFIDDITHNIQ